VRVGRPTFVVASCATLLLVALAVVANQLLGSAGAQERLACVAETDVVPEQLVPGFVPLGRQELKAIPFVRGVSSEAMDFVGGTTVGFVSEYALTEQYKSQNDEQARSQGYEVSELPSVPLSGQIVAENPVPLEVYGSVFVFGDNRGAEVLIGRLRESGTGTDGVVDVPITFTDVGDESFGLHSMLGPDPARDEQLTVVNARVGSIVVQVATRGGLGMSDELAIALGRNAVDIVTACQ